MIQRSAQMFDVEGRVMCNQDVSLCQLGQQILRNGREFRGVQNIQMRQTVTFNEVVIKPAVAFRWSHEPIRSFGQIAILKDGQPGGADAHARGIRRFKIETDKVHRLGHMRFKSTDVVKIQHRCPSRWQRRRRFRQFFGIFAEHQKQVTGMKECLDDRAS